MKKKVAINARFLIKGKLEGFGWFTYHTAKRLVERHPEIQFYFLFDRTYDHSFVFAENVKPIVLFPQARHPILFRWWFDFSVTRFLKKESVDLFISPDGYLSLRTDTLQIAVIHDLNFEHYPEDLLPHHSRYLRKYFPKFAQKATKIITVSKFSKRDIINTYGISHEKISVAYNGVDAHFKINRNVGKNELPYFLFVGSIHPRKNLKRVLAAFDMFKKSAASNIQLKVVGDPYFWSDEMKLALANLQHKDSVVFEPYATKEKLVKLYQNAHALLFVSYFEGFGIPIIEAMACGCPVVVAKNTACEEIAEGAALLVDPFNESEIMQRMLELTSNPALLEDLKKKGLHRAQYFNWDKTTDILENAMLKLLEK